MSLICFGGVCIPVNAVWPLVLFGLKYLWETFSGPILRLVSGTNAQALDARPVDELPDVPYVASKEDWDAKLAAGDLVIADFTADWCKPCKKVFPFFRRLAATYGDRATFVRVDVDDLDDVAEVAKVTAMPTFQAYRGGALVGSVSGANEANLQAFVEDQVAAGKKAE
mmetsp:Transcript_2689/g.7897  ORF Transcript_2689/g.7897 Transcript_2689/m.7897 type:complete len:168 (+) Transcript_2689:148-651(+)